MKLGKRQLVLATLVVALGAAVYLSWTLSDHEGLKVTESLTANSETSTYGNAELVNAGEDEMLQQTMLSNTVQKNSEEENSAVESATENASESASDSVSEKENSAVAQTMAEAKLSRQQARDEASDLLDELLKDQDSDNQATAQAAEKAAQIADTILKENNIETLIKAKGYSDCIAILENDQCNVMLSIEMAQPNDAVIIKDIVHSQTGIEYDAIKIIEIQ